LLKLEQEAEELRQVLIPAAQLRVQTSGRQNEIDRLNDLDQDLKDKESEIKRVKRRIWLQTNGRKILGAVGAIALAVLAFVFFLWAVYSVSRSDAKFDNLDHRVTVVEQKQTDLEQRVTNLENENTIHLVTCPQGWQQMSPDEFNELTGDACLDSPIPDD